MNTRNKEVRQLARDITDFVSAHTSYLDFSDRELFVETVRLLKNAEDRKFVINSILELEVSSPATSSLIERIVLLK